ncbi:WXG100 family type VII secretion target [Paenibacillus dokdonensis]|uniref:WXG100 family type VII secretion target n=1 Tax=Paenibacillus dokdonensis TaxID=2567944 RepID=A0ABU6GT06_9BACL|nr:WXG100 family type VII secretion target [Paenibacillus dokdonensis]MEC0242868.1 WXG100 family type VII secretion target [Paenibacillus dokdonensis]
MTTIKVTPDQLLQASNQFSQAGQWAQQTKSILDQQILMMESIWYGVTKERFYQDFYTARDRMQAFVTLVHSISLELKRHANEFRAADLIEDKPIPELCRVPEDKRNFLEKSTDSLSELGEGIYKAAEERNEKKFDSVSSFLDYLSFGIPKALVTGYVDRADHWLDSPDAFVNHLSFGFYGTIKGAVEPEEAWSPEHWANMLGLTTVVAGGTSISEFVKSPKLMLEAAPKAGLVPKFKESPGVKEGGVQGTGNTIGNFAGKINAENIPNMSKQEILDSLPKDWKYTDNNGFVHIRDANGNVRMKIDPPDKVTKYDHVHLFDESGNPIDVNLNVVDRKSLDAHIPYKK